MPDGTPELSVVLATGSRPDLVAPFLELLAAQTLAPERFEVVLAGDGAAGAVAGRAPFSVRAAATRAEALASSAGRWCLLLDVEALPAADLLERHLALHRERARAGLAEAACQGARRASASATLASPFTEILDRAGRLERVADGEPCAWNVSVPASSVRDLAERDESAFAIRWRRRLRERGLALVRERAALAHDTRVWTLAAWLESAAREGAERARRFREDGDGTALGLAQDARADAAFVRRLQAACESLEPAQRKLAAVLSRVERDLAAKTLPPELVRQLAGALARVEELASARGMLRELTGHDPLPVLERGARPGRLTSVIVVSCEALAATRECIEALRRHREAEHPIEILVVDNGSRDGSREWLAAQADVALVANERNAGAPRARNQALALARGELVAFLDNDVVVTPRWLSRLLFHLDVDARAACVGPVCDRAAHGQAIAFAGGDDALDAFAEARQRELTRQFRLGTLLSSFCLLTRRATIERIGGFDERFSPWGFEDDDFTLRALLASGGGHNRVALDVFVRHRAYGSAEKSAAHRELLARNWRRFADKWGLPASAAHGDYAGLEPLLADVARHASDARLCVPLATPSTETDSVLESARGPASTSLAGATPCAT